MNESPLAIVYVLCKDKILNFLSILNVQFQKKNLELKICHFTIHVCFDSLFTKTEHFQSVSRLPTFFTQKKFDSRTLLALLRWRLAIFVDQLEYRSTHVQLLFSFAVCFSVLPEK